MKRKLKLKPLKAQPMSIDHAYKIANIATICVFSLVIVALIVLFSIFFKTESREIIIAIYIASLVVSVALGVWVFTIFRHNRKNLYLGMYNVTKENYERIKNNKNTLVPYDESIFTSFKDLNEQLNQIQNNFNQSVLFNSELKYEDMSFDFVSLEYRVVTYESFVKNYRQLILRSLVYRNAFISFNFKVNNKPLSIEEKKQFTKNISEIFQGRKLLFVDRTEINQIIVFVPMIDSIDHLKEQLDKCAVSTPIARYGEDGYSLLSCRVSAVVFPYSDIDRVLIDLEYASRQNDQVNIYLPKRSIVKNDNLLQMNVNLNFIYSILEKFAKIDLNNFENKEMQKAFNSIMSELASVYHLDYTSLFAYKNDDQQITPFYSYNREGNSNEPFIKELPENMLETISKHMDEDHTYFFSNRKNLTPEIGRYFDAFGINSGFLYVVIEQDKPLGLIMFCKKGDMVIDSYLREALYIFSRTISNIIFYVNATAQKRLINYRLVNVLKIANYKAYSVDKRNYKLLSISTTLKDTIPEAKVGQLCYEALYGRNKPCAKCPLVNGHKMYEELRGVRYESSLALSIPRMNEKAVLLSPVQDDIYDHRERYDRDLLVYSFFSLLERMSYEFAMSARGYVVLVNIDNHDELLKGLNPESYNEYLRSIFREITESMTEVKDIFFLPNRTFAIIFRNGHRKNIFPILEKIYNISKKPFKLNDKEYNLTLTYLSHSYPFGYQNSTEYVRYILSLWDNHKEHWGDDRIILPETKYVRSASHKIFVEEVLENSLDASTFTTKLQPVVNKTTRNIESAEMLLRVPETYLGSEMNTFEIINAAAENKKIALITKILIDHIGELYNTYGETLFTRFNVKHLSLNTDYSFFEDLTFINEMKEMGTKFDLPDDFLKFEIRESEIAKFSDEFIPITKELAKNNIEIVCDNYTGEFLSLQDIKRLGFSGVKIDRSVIAKLNTDVTTIDGLISYIDEAKTLGLDVTFVGVETKEQFDVLKTIENDFHLQGYYFYKPLDAEELINVLLRKNS